MATVVIPFAGMPGKSRLHESGRIRRQLALAMLGDVLAACLPLGSTRVVTSDGDGAALARDVGASVVEDPGGGQNAAVTQALDGVEPGATVVVNSDVPCAIPADVRALLAATPAGGMALVEANDGTTNALSISAPELFAPVYGRDSAAQFRAHAAGLGVDAVSVAIPNLADDVDTAADLRRLHLRLGPRSQACLATLRPEDLA